MRRPQSKISNRCKTSVLLLTTLFAFGCSHPKTKEELAAHPEEAPPKTVANKPPESSIEAKQVAAEEEASYVTEVSFRKNQSALRNDARQKIKKIVDQAQRRGKISEVIIVSWADAEYPSAKQKKLSNDQIHLGEDRGEQVKAYVKTVSADAKLSTYNMAERPGALADLFGSGNAKVKKALEKAAIPTTDQAAPGTAGGASAAATSATAASAAKAGKAIVMIVLKE